STFYLLPSAFCLLPSAFCLLPSTFYLLPSAFDAYHPGHPAGALAVGAVRVQHACVRLRTQRRHVDCVGRHAGGLELIAIRAPEVHVRPARCARRKPPRERRRVVTGIAKGFDNFVADFPATWSERRSDRRHQIGG